MKFHLEGTTLAFGLRTFSHEAKLISGARKGAPLQLFYEPSLHLPEEKLSDARQSFCSIVSKPRQCISNCDKTRRFELKTYACLLEQVYVRSLCWTEKTDWNQYSHFLFYFLYMPPSTNHWYLVFTYIVPQGEATNLALYEEAQVNARAFRTFCGGETIVIEKISAVQIQNHRLQIKRMHQPARSGLYVTTD